MATYILFFGKEKKAFSQSLAETINQRVRRMFGFSDATKREKEKGREKYTVKYT